MTSLKENVVIEMSEKENDDKINDGKEQTIDININNMNKTELVSKCKELGIKGISSKNKAQLVDIINEKINKNSGINLDKNAMIEMRLKPLIKWSGGKSDEIKLFEKYIPANYDTYLEPFIGGGSLYFYLSPKKSVISDVHTELIDLYSCIGEGKAKDIYDFMATNPNDEETYYKIRDKMEIKEKLDNAKRFYYQRKTCFRGMSRYNKSGKFNIPFGKYTTINYSDLQNNDYETLLSRTEILNKGFEHVFENYNSADNFMFLDPPYLSSFNAYYDGYVGYDCPDKDDKIISDNTKLFIDILDFIKVCKCKCMLIINKNAITSYLYKDFVVGEYDKMYQLTKKKTKHLIVCNYKN